MMTMMMLCCVDSCVYGDYRGLYEVDRRDLSCPEIGSQAPHKCYETSVAEDCCETCPSVRRTDIEGTPALHDCFYTVSRKKTHQL